MKDPERLRVRPGTELERILLDTGASYRGSDDLRFRTLVALGIGGATVATTATASALGTGLGRLVWWKTTLMVSAVGALATVPVVYDSREHKPVVVVASPPSSVMPTQLVPEIMVEPVRDEVEDAAPPVASVTPVVERAVRTTRGAPSALELRLELQALDEARSSLGAGEPSRALEKLDGYARDYPKGRLRMEAEVLRIDALFRSGQRELARKRAATFLKRHPNSVLASRVRIIVGDSGL